MTQDCLNSPSTTDVNTRLPKGIHVTGADDKSDPAIEGMPWSYLFIWRSRKDIFTMPAEFGWSDLGSWGSLRTLLPQDENGNAKVAKDIRLYECKNCVVHAADESKVVVQGLDGYIVAEKHGQLLVCSLKEEQRIKEFGK